MRAAPINLGPSFGVFFIVGAMIFQQKFPVFASPLAAILNKPIGVLLPIFSLFGGVVPGARGSTRGGANARLFPEL
jgi:hypothetical protein